MVERLALDAIELLQARGHGRGIGEDHPGFGQADAVDRGDRLARAAVLSR